MSYIINHGHRYIRFYDIKTLNLKKEERDPLELTSGGILYRPSCKNCQISSSEIILGNHTGAVLYVKNLFTQKEIKLKRVHNDDISCTDSILNKLLLSSGGYKDPSICLWSVNNKKLIHKFENCHKKGIYSVKFLNENNLFASGSDDKTVKIFDYLKLKQIKSFKAHSQAIWDLSVYQKLLFSCSGDKTINIFDVKKKKKLKRIKGLFDCGLSSVLNFDANYLLTGDHEGNLYSLDKRNLKDVVYKKKLHFKKIERILKNDNNSITTGSEDRFIKIINCKSGNELFNIKDKDHTSGIFLFKNENNNIFAPEKENLKKIVKKKEDELEKKEKEKVLRKKIINKKEEEVKHKEEELKNKVNEKLKETEKLNKNLQNEIFNLKKEKILKEEENNNDIKQEKKTLKDFLNDLDLERFYGNFLKDGIVYVSELECVEDDDVEEYIPKKFLRKKFLKHLRKYFDDYEEEDDDIGPIC